MPRKPRRKPKKLEEVQEQQRKPKKARHPKGPDLPPVDNAEPVEKLPPVDNWEIAELAKRSEDELRRRCVVAGKLAAYEEHQKQLHDKSITYYHCEQGLLLLALEKKLPRKYGNYGKALASLGIKRQRAPEYKKVALHFGTPVKAGKVGWNEAIKLAVRAGDKGFKDCFAAPDWVKEALEREFGLPALDVAASHDMHFGKKFYTPKEDGLKQNWVKDAGGRGSVIYCNPPYFSGNDPKHSNLWYWCQKAYDAAEKGCIVVCLLPFWKYEDFFKDWVVPYAEVRHPAEPLVLQGFGQAEGHQSGDVQRGTRNNPYCSIIAVFRKIPGEPKQKGLINPMWFNKNWGIRKPRKPD